MRVKIFVPIGCDRTIVDDRSWAEIPEGSTVRDVLRMIKCSPAKAKILLVSVNGERAKLGFELHEGDVLGFFSLVSGG